MFNYKYNFNKDGTRAKCISPKTFILNVIFCNSTAVKEKNVFMFLKYMKVNKSNISDEFEGQPFAPDT